MMNGNRGLLFASIAIFLGMVVLTVATEGTGVIRNDPSRNIFIPEELIMPLQVKAAYNGEKMFFRYRWPQQPG